MKTLILKPQFIDRGGYTVYFVYEDDPNCRITRPGRLVGQMRFDGNTIQHFEPIEQQGLELSDD